MMGAIVADFVDRFFIDRAEQPRGRVKLDLLIPKTTQPKKTQARRPNHLMSRGDSFRGHGRLAEYDQTR